ncbi:MAG: tetratricopeptide repeat protein [Ignavibacterium sp.]
MHQKLSSDLLSRFSEFVSKRMGLSFPGERWGELERGIYAAGAELGFHEPSSLVEWFLSAQPEKRHTEILASYLTVGETYFFRDARTIQALRQYILPSLIAARREHKRLRIWSAGCCTGEEPYTLATLLHSLLPDFNEWNITLLATDINPRFLQKASEAIYSEWSFRETPAWVKERYFLQRPNGRYALLPVIRDAVTFAPLNLVDDSYPSFLTNTNAMDLVVCRNVLMYFHPNAARSVARKLFHSLVDDGWLLVSPSEMSQSLFAEFDSVHVGEALSYRKSKKKSNDTLFHFSDPTTPQPPVSETETAEQLPEPLVASFSAETILPDDEQKIEEEVSSETPDVYLKAFSEYERGAFDSAADYLYAALEKDPHDARLFALLARILASQGDLNRAEQEIQKAIAADKLNHSYRYLHAMISHELGDDEKASRSLREAIYLNAGSALSHFLLATVERRNGKTREANRHFEWTRHLLAEYAPDDLLPESDGMTAGRLLQMIDSILEIKR